MTKMSAARQHETVLSLKQVGANGQISLGKEFAGQTVQVEQSEPGVWVVKTVVVIPTNEMYLHQPETYAGVQRAMTWAVENPPAESDLMRLFGDENDASKGSEKPTRRRGAAAAKKF